MALSATILFVSINKKSHANPLLFLSHFIIFHFLLSLFDEWRLNQLIINHSLINCSILHPSSASCPCCLCVSSVRSPVTIVVIIMSDMEEGELSDHGEEFPPPDQETPAPQDARSGLAGRLGPRKRGKTFGASDPGFGPLQVTFNNVNKDLPVIFDKLRFIWDFPPS